MVLSELSTVERAKNMPDESDYFFILTGKCEIGSDEIHVEPKC